MKPSWIEQSGAMVNRENFDQFLRHPIDNTVVAEDDFAKRWVSRFGNDPSTVREAADPFDGGEDIHDKEGCIVR